MFSKLNRVFLCIFCCLFLFFAWYYKSVSFLTRDDLPAWVQVGSLAEQLMIMNVGLETFSREKQWCVQTDCEVLGFSSCLWSQVGFTYFPLLLLSLHLSLPLSSLSSHPAVSHYSSLFSLSLHFSILVDSLHPSIWQKRNMLHGFYSWPLCLCFHLQKSTW